MNKHFYTQFGVGKTKYIVNFWDGQKRHPDGSIFYDIRIFKNKPALSMFESQLTESGYSKN